MLQTASAIASKRLQRHIAVIRPVLYHHTATMATAPNNTTAGKPSQPLIVHHLNNSRSQRILWLLEELHLPYEIKYYQRTSQQLAPPELKKVFPTGKSPILQDGNQIVAESGNIVEYLLERYDSGKQFQPRTETDRQNNRYWLHAAEGSIMPFLTFTAVLSGIDKNSPWIIRPIAHAITNNVRHLFTEPSLTSYFNYIEDYLTKQKTDFFCGSNLTASDIMLSFPLETASQRGTQFVGQQTRAWVERIHARPAYKRALEKGGEYAYA